MAAASNADDYASARQNIFFPANNQTSADGNLTGQCVTLLKWFFQEMCNGFPSPFAARGDARYVGENLVAQGLAVEVSFDQRRRGDVICYEYGTYGHIALQLSGGRVFEENVNWSGVATRVVDGEVVHASRIGSEAEAWRVGKNPHVYRLKSYIEGDPDMINNTDNEYARWRDLGWRIRGRELTREEFRASAVGLTWLKAIEILSDNEEANQAQRWQDTGRIATQDDWPGQIYGLQDQVKALTAKLNAGKNVTDAERDELVQATEALKQSIIKASE